MGPRAGEAIVAKHIKTMNARWSALQARSDALRRVQHFRNKVLAHATTGLNPDQQVIIGDLWALSRLVLTLAKYVRLVVEREEWDYLAHSRDGKAHANALVMALHRDGKASIEE